MKAGYKLGVWGVMALGGAVAEAAQSPSQFYATETEIHGYADLNGNGFMDGIIIDRASGAVRVGFGSAGSPNWSAPHPAGLYGVTGVTAGRFIDPNRDTLALTAPLMNRVFYFGLMGASATPTMSVIAPLAVGPHSLAGGQLQGTTATEDILLLSDRNFTTLHRVDFLTIGAAGAITNATSPEASTGGYSAAQRVMLSSGSTTQVGYLEQGAGTATLKVRALSTFSSPIIFTLAGLDPEVRYLIQPFASGQGELITWVPGATQYSVRIFSSSFGVFSVTSTATMTVPFPLGYVAAVPADSGSQLLLISADATQALIRHVPSQLAGQAISAPSGQFFTGVLPMANGLGQFQLLVGAQPFGRSLQLLSYVYDGTEAYLLDDADVIPSVTATSGAGNVLVYAGEPFVAPDARVLSRMRAGDWSSNPVLGASVLATAETYRGAADGLGNPASTTLGAAPSGATHVLANQFDPAISVFGLAPAHGPALNPLTILPTPGIYPTAVKVSIGGGPGGWLLRYRTAPDQLWQSYTGPFWIHKTTTVEAMAILGPIARTPITAVTYTIPTPPGELSSMDDGVPDYVKIGLEFDPSQLPDREGEINDFGSYNYLQILLEGSGIDPRRLTESALRLHVRPHGHNGLDDHGIAAFRHPQQLADGSPNPGVRVDVRDISGELIDTGVGDSWEFFGNPETAAVLSSVGLGGRSSLLIAATSSHYPLYLLPPFDAGSLLQGREIVGLLTLPESSFVPYTRTYTGGSDLDEANAWVSGAIAHFHAQTIPEAGRTLNGYDTTSLMVFEHWVARRMVDRGLLPSAYLPPAVASALPADRLTLTPFRGGETAAELNPNGVNAGLVFATPEQLQTLASYHSPSDPGYDLVAFAGALRDAIANSADARIAALRAVTDDIYRISARWAGLFPGAFPSPVDALREFAYTGSPPAGYTNTWPDGLPAAIGTSITTLSNADYASARQGIDLLLNLASPRPFVTHDLRVLPQSEPHRCTVLQRTDTGSMVALVDTDGQRFRFPGSFQLIPDSILRVSGYTDRPAGSCAPATLEVAFAGEQFLAMLAQVPLPDPSDSDGNLLADDWELLFLGSTGNDPWSSPANDGYSLVQIFLSGGDPLQPLSYNQNPAMLTMPPAIDISPATLTDLMISWDFPAAFAPFVQFSLQTNSDLSASWDPLSATVNYLGSDRFYLLIPDPESDEAPVFWRIAFGLR